jgi:hypothetical protein
VVENHDVGRFRGGHPVRVRFDDPEIPLLFCVEVPVVAKEPEANRQFDSRDPVAGRQEEPAVHAVTF